ncbi:unnamed protein product [Caenorhabditis bovis]|uniref:Uncharacterized protein n=1 Tax=Caenorhabditis bovis TaxID=2654633 RepID=A0A8S1EB01_9PELO|nr:unnamed protein product [Caenorhabditis bovis]
MDPSKKRTEALYAVTAMIIKLGLSERKRRELYRIVDTLRMHQDIMPKNLQCSEVENKAKNLSKVDYEKYDVCTNCSSYFGGRKCNNPGCFEQIQKKNGRKLYLYDSVSQLSEIVEVFGVPEMPKDEVPPPCAPRLPQAASRGTSTPRPCGLSQIRINECSRDALTAVRNLRSRDKGYRYF